MITGINHITISVSDVGRSFAFYTDTLGLRAVARWSTGAYLQAGPTWVALVQERGVAHAVRPDYSHIALTVPPKSFQSAAAALDAAGAPSWKGNTSEGESRYFLDPDGHKLEIHATDLEDRLASMRRHPWDRIEFYGAAEATGPRVVQVCDIHDSTHIGLELGERMGRFMEEYYSDLAEIAVSSGGRVIEYYGDCMCFVRGPDDCLAAVESALAMRSAFALMLERHGVRTESELENGVSSGEVALRTVGHPTYRVVRASGVAVSEALSLGCHRGVAITAPVKERVEGRYSIRRIPDMTVRWRTQPLVAWEISEAHP